MIVLDTNILSEPIRPTPNEAVRAWFDTQDGEALFTCAPVLAELRFGVERLGVGRKQRWLSENIERLEEQFGDRILSFDAGAAIIYARIVAAREKSGHHLDVMDGMIAAITLQHSAMLATRNRRHFAGLGLTIINPFDFTA